MNSRSQGESGYYAADHCDLGEFQTLVEQRLAPEAVPNACAIENNIPIYDVSALEKSLKDPVERRNLMAEWATVLKDGAGVFALKQAQPDHSAIDHATQIYERIIAKEKQDGAAEADHFAAAGCNDRIWNSLQKLCAASPETFIRYFTSPVIDAAAEAWLGPHYQMTAQINLVHPGGKAQQAHRDYHLGFQTAEANSKFPRHVHDLSPLMTLQGAIAHNDMALESGPTKLLPFSQLYRPGYVAWRRDDFRALFEEQCVQLPLEKGDAVFFNPALFHAAGENRSVGVRRMVNLLQISSAFGRAMESVDRLTMCKSLYQPLSEAWKAGKLGDDELDAVIAATAEGYPFPTNLDSDPPVENLAPATQSALLKRSVVAQLPEAEFVRQLEQQSARRHA